MIPQIHVVLCLTKGHLSNIRLGLFGIRSVPIRGVLLYTECNAIRKLIDQDGIEMSVIQQR